MILKEIGRKYPLKRAGASTPTLPSCKILMRLTPKPGEGRGRLTTSQIGVLSHTPSQQIQQDLLCGTDVTELPRKLPTVREGEIWLPSGQTGCEFLFPNTHASFQWSALEGLPTEATLKHSCVSGSSFTQPVRVQLEEPHIL